MKQIITTALLAIITGVMMLYAVALITLPAHADNALSELVEAFLTSYPKADILGVSMINQETAISACMVRGLFEG